MRAIGSLVQKFHVADWIADVRASRFPRRAKMEASVVLPRV